VRKEVLFAIILGIILGGVIIYGIQIANKSVNEPAATITPTPTSAEPAVSSLSITSPRDHSVSPTNSLTITGIAKPNSQVLVVNDEDEFMTSADAAGIFSGKIDLTGGENIITVSSLSPDQNLETVELTIIYSTAKIE